MSDTCARNTESSPGSLYVKTRLPATHPSRVRLERRDATNHKILFDNVDNRLFFSGSSDVCIARERTTPTSTFGRLMGKQGISLPNPRPSDRSGFTPRNLAYLRYIW